MAAKFKYYDGSKWVKPSEVNANPTLAGTETELTCLEIDGVKYKIPVGGGSAIGDGALYQHKIIVNDGVDDYDFVFLSKRSEPFVDGDSLMDFLTVIGAANDDNVIISPMIKKDGASAAEIVNGMVVNGQIYSVVITTVSGNINFTFQSNLEIFDTVSTYIVGGSGSGGGDSPDGGTGSSEITTTLVSVHLGRAEDITMAEYNAYFVIADNVLNDGIALANQQLSQLGITLTKDNWSTTVSTLLSTNQGKQVFNFLMQQLLANSINVYGADYDGYTTKVFIGSIGDWTIGDDRSPLVALSSTLTQGYTLQGIGAGGGSGSGGSGKLYVLKFTATIHQSSVRAYNFELCIYESNFERFKYEASLVGITINSIQDVVDLINSYNYTTTQTQTATLMFYTLINNCDLKFCEDTVSAENDLLVGADVLGGYSQGGHTIFDLFSDSDGEDVYFGIDVNNSCTLTEYGTSASGGSGGTVEAEPIVKITMTNIDCRELDNDPQALRDIIVYCTKERWDNFVALASSEFSVDFTYQNFATVYPQLTREEQGFVFGYLLMDYYDGKILPNSVMINKDTPMAQYGQIFEMPFNASVTMKNDTTGNIEIVVDGNWGMGTASGAFPIGESNSGTYTTASSVITVEEIAGAAVGSGGGSSEDAGGAHTKYTVTAQYNSNELKLMLYFLCNEEELYSDLNAGFVLLNTRLGISLNTHCASESDIVDNFNILQQIDTTGGSDPDNNALVFGALGLLVRTEKCIKVTMPYIAEFGTDLNSVDVIRSNGQLGGMGLYYVNDSGVNTPINVSAFVGHTGVTYGCNIEEIDASGSGSGSGGSQPATGPTYCYVQVSSDTVSNNIIYMFDRRSADRQDMVDGVNLLITTLNSMFSVSIPSYSSIDDLPTIASYINSLDTANYGTLKVIWWASLFNSFQYLSLSVKLYSTGWVLPVLIFARSDQLNNQYSYCISYIDDINQLQSLWTSNDTFDFSIHVDDLD